MGKKTTAFITAIEAQQDKFKQSTLDYIRNCETLTKLDVQQYNLEEKQKARREQLRASANNDTAAYQKLLTTDAEYLKLDKDIHAFEKIASGTVKSREETAEKLSVIALAMGPKIADFEKYIAKKEKSKNPFKSKKSIPAAKDFISVSHTFAEAAKNYVRDTLKLNLM